MQATDDQIKALYAIQQLDSECARLNKIIDELPQKQAILKDRQKREEIQKKLRGLVGLRKDTQLQADRLRDEDARLAAKQAEAQKKIDESHGDFRSVTSHSKEIAGHQKRRDAIKVELETLDMKLLEVADVEPQVQKALSIIDADEAKQTEEYKRVGGEYVAQIRERKAQRAQIAKILGPNLLAMYEKTAVSKGGVAVSLLQNGACSACRSKIDPSRVLAIRAEFPLSKCPVCGRMMIVDKRYKG